MRQTVKVKLLQSVFSCLYSTVKLLLFAVNSGRHFPISVVYLKNIKSEVIFAVLPSAVNVMFKLYISNASVIVVPYSMKWCCITSSFSYINVAQYWFNFGFDLLAATSLGNKSSGGLFIGSFVAFTVHREARQTGYDSQLSKAQRKSGDLVFTFNLCCCNGKMALSPVPTYQPLTSLAARFRGNTVITTALLYLT